MMSLHNAIEPQGPGLLAESQKRMSHPGTTEGRLPHLLYIGDVPVESSYHGSALLYRLLEDYPSERLRVVEGNVLESQSERRLPGVTYKTLQVGSRRLLNTRFHRWYSLWLSLRSSAWQRRVPALLNHFNPEAVLTVAHGHLWVTAAEFARRRGLPLHLIIHDDWAKLARPPVPFTNLIESKFLRIYREAASRLCVSPFMVEEYRRRYGADGQVLYPSRGKDARQFDAPAERLQLSSGGLTVAFAGTINTPGYCLLLRTLAACLERHDGKLLIYGPLTTDQAAAAGLNRSNIRLGGMLKSAELMDRLRAEADVLFVPMSFAAGDRPNMELSFPSKLTDYTAVGLPLLIWGPEYCSAVRWARLNSGVAEIVDMDDSERLAQSIARLADDSQYRTELANAAITVGHRHFSHDAAQDVFRSALHSSS